MADNNYVNRSVVRPLPANVKFLRRQSWTVWLSDQARQAPFDQKKLEPLLGAVGYG